jgi:hypothetical protein
VNLAVEPSFTLLGLHSTAKIHDAENNQSTYSNKTICPIALTALWISMLALTPGGYAAEK